MCAAPIAAAPDVVFSGGATPPWRATSVRAGKVRYRTPADDHRPDDNLVVRERPEGFFFRYADGTEFWLARDGGAIWAMWPASSTVADMATYLLGPVLGFAQRVRGVLCLHASAVIVDGGAVALCGASEAGKSTTAGALAAAGYEVLTDDLTALHDDGAEIMAMAGYGQLRVWEDSEAILLGVSGVLPRVTPTWEKRALALRERGWGFRAAPAPIRAVVLLAARERGPAAPRVEPVAAGEAFVAIAANTYANYLLDDRMRAGEFTAIARLMSAVVVLRATPHTDPQKIGELVARIAAAARA